MKTIVISGTHSEAEKKILATELSTLLPNSFKVKINQGNIHLNDIKHDCSIYLSVDVQNSCGTSCTEKADIINCTRISDKTIRNLAKDLGLPKTIIRKMAWLSGARPEPASAIILAGGESSRMGTDKALLEIDGVKTVKRLHGILLPYFDEIVISTGPNSKNLFPGIKIVKDKKERFGPLMGIYSALEESASLVNFIIACDIPEVNMPLIFKLLSTSEEYDISLPSFSEGRFEPLYGVYRKDVISAAKKMLDLKKRRIASIFEECKTLILPSDGGSWYTNLNTPVDYRNYLDSVRNITNIL